jgi:serine/threonine-protein kinase
MERLDGGTLADEIARGPLSEARLRLVGAQMLDALAAAHDNGVLHRDVKPSNVLRAPDGSVRVGDFGIAKTDLATDGTTTGTVVGTLGYLAPERLEGRPATASSDCYSVAVVLYEALSGQRPFTGDSPVAVLASVQRAEPTSLAELRPDVDPALRDTITVAMSSDPRDRFASAKEFASAVRGEIKPPRRVPPTVRAAAAAPDPTEVFDAPVPARPGALRPPVPPPPAPNAPPARVAKPAVRGGKLVVLFLALIAIGAMVGIGVGLVLRDDGGTDGAPPASGDPVEDALRQLEEAITP